jgi:hypothetical protein
MQTALPVGNAGGLKIWEKIFISGIPESQGTKRNLDSLCMNCYFYAFNYQFLECVTL